MPEALLTAEEVAAFLGVARRFVHDEVKRKNLRGIKLPGRVGWRFEPADVERYIAARANVSRVRGDLS